MTPAPALSYERRMPTRSPGRVAFYSRLSHRPAGLILQMAMEATSAGHNAPAFRFESRQRHRRKRRTRPAKHAPPALPAGGVPSLLRP
jgi:hypothetical protein